MTTAKPNIQDFLEQLLSEGKALMDPNSKGRQDITQKGKALYQQGEDYLADKLSIGDDAESRKDLRDKAKIAAGAGGLALLLSSRSGRKLATLGGLGALGMIAFKAHQAGRMPKNVDDVIGLIKGEKAEKRANILLQAMVAAAQADGEISHDEKTLIEAHEGASETTLLSALKANADPKAIAALAENDQTAYEIYAVSCRIANGLHPKERDYLDRLAMELRLDPEMAAQVETEVRTG
ncbi:uncharacterized membrane protein YebE (DUF533 family) [Litorimonas taeanensis]|uniref:Uncharacterized membrane protein YebE (DUF533 family) n=1 Tax=Litorimonas taeanensis TaxID=568099 RepID=A0A420WJC8_9PROT|nr:DUF533 domain-containing protein [Litorimonas taeanensis]RKQ71039.1 uncharacterized membrane protein YebE (DUF533 family) [Litorimonas taeanensis]